MSIQFSHELIKGRIAETVFEQMIRDEGRYDVIPFGYEHTMPLLMQYQQLIEIKQVMENIKDAPDFALISNDKRKVYLVEVKYRTQLNIKEILGITEHLLMRWRPSWLFIASPDGFYCAPCRIIIKEKNISRLSEKWVAVKRQADYLNLLNEFEKK